MDERCRPPMENNGSQHVWLIDGNRISGDVPNDSFLLLHRPGLSQNVAKTDAD
ncbi:hypothetical protein Mal52_45760 [Symmachiella dynata]|uniref:Uncharacterized protein n=1 Tax=Symmachiella dynata TaxID=2527995 RepID=A0A517ZUD6_9PLAN|nr:hypothetical protein Mal52_45760 [Symmachiella dynata]